MKGNKETEIVVSEESIKKATEFLEEHKGEILLKEKYFQSQKLGLQVDTKELYAKAPDMPLKKVILTLMEPLPDFLPADNLVEVTKIITSCWTELSKKAAA